MAVAVGVKPTRCAQLNRSDPLARGLIGAWLLNEGTGGTAYDGTGNGNAGTLTAMDSATDWVGGRDGWALDFDGSDDYILVSDYQANMKNPIKAADAVTIVIGTTLSSKADDKGLFSSGDKDGLVEMWYDVGNDCWACRVFGAGYWQDDNNATVATIGAPTQLALSGGGGQAKLYQDGRFIVGSTYVSPLGSLDNSSEEFWLGKDFHHNPYLGTISYCYLWKRVLGAGSITQLALDPYRLWRPSSSPGWLYAAAGGTTHEGAAALSADGDFTAAALRRALGAATLSGNADVTASGVRKALGAAALSVDADLMAGVQTSGGLARETLDFIRIRDIADYSLARDSINQLYARDTVRYDTP